MSENTLKIGFVGAGGIHFGKNKPWAHATRLEKIGGIDVVAIVDPKTDLAQKVLEEKLANDEVRSLYKNCRVFANFRQLLELKPDAVFIGSPPAYRGCLLNNHDMELQFVKAGIHTFVEKPLSVIPPEEFEMYATEMKNAIKETNVVVSVGYMFRYHAAVDKMKQIIESHGHKIMAYNAKFSYAYTLGGNKLLYDLMYSGGPMIYQATHVIDLARYIVGDVDHRSISTIVLRDDDSSGAGKLSYFSHDGENDIPSQQKFPRVTMSHFKFSNGALGSILHTHAIPGNKHDISIEIQCDGLQLVMTKPVDDVSILRVRHYKSSNPNEEVEYIFDRNDCYHNELVAFVNAIRTGDKSSIRCTYDDASKSYLLSWQLRKSGEEN